MTPPITLRVALPLVAFLVASLTMAFVLYRSGGGQLPGGDNYRFQAVVPTAVALSPGAQVRMAGVEVGRVADIASRSGTAVLDIEVDEKHAPVYRDARAQVRLKSLIGENYVDIDAGTRSAGVMPENGVLPLANADEATQLDQVLSVLDRRSQQDVREVLDGLGGGLRDRGRRFNELGETMSAAVREGRPVTEVLDRQRARVATLVDDLGRVMQAVGDRGTAVRVLARQAKTAAIAVGSRDRLLKQSIAELPATLRQTQRTTAGLGRLSRSATPVVSDLAAGMDGLGPSVMDLRPTAEAARSTMRALETFARRGTPLLKDLERFSAKAVPALPAVDRTLSELNPLLAYLAPYSREIGAVLPNLGSAAGFRDATGNMARVLGVYNEGSPLVKTPEMNKLLDALLETGALSRVRTQGNNPYPAPGEMAKPKKFTGKVPRLEALPHVLP